MDNDNTMPREQAELDVIELDVPEPAAEAWLERTSHVCRHCGRGPGIASAKRTLWPEDVVKAVCAEYGVTPSELLSHDRHAYLARARMVAMYLARKHVGSSYPELGRFFSKRDHTTVMSACRKIEARMQTDERLRVVVERLEKELAA